MVTEDYVSFETAKLLKEKGFIGECIAYYSNYKDNNANLHRWRNRQNYVDVRNNGYTLVPTLQMAMKWLRKVHRLEIYPFHEMLQGSAWWYRIERNTGLSLIVEKEEDAIYGTYEQACEYAIKYCLENLI